MEAAGIQPRFVQGRRYTDEPTLEIVERVLAYETNEAIAEQIEQYGGRSAPLNFRTTNILWGERLKLGAPDGEQIDLGNVGQVTRVDRSTIDNLCFAGIVPVIPSMCRTEKGRYGRHCRRPGNGGRETDFFERRERGAPKQTRPQLADPLAYC